MMMGSHNQPLAGQIPQMQSSQQLGLPGQFWPPYPSQVMFDPWMANQLPTMGPMLPQQPPHPSSLPQVIDPGQEQPPWFQALVAAVSSEIKNNFEKQVTVTPRDADEKMDSNKAALGDLSPKDEKVLMDALKKRDECGLTVQQVFKELSQKHGHAEMVWKTWFIANFEKLYPKAAGNFDSTGSPSGGIPSIDCQAESSTRSVANESSWSPTTTVINEPEQSSGESERSESESGDDDDDLRATSHPRPPTACETSRKAPINREPVTNADLRAMALYIREKSGDFGTRDYRRSSWREFAERPENRKRSLDAWTGIPRIAKHAAMIVRLVKKYQKEAEGAKYKAGLPILSRQDRFVASSSGAQRQLAGAKGAIDLSAEAEE